MSWGRPVLLGRRSLVVELGVSGAGRAGDLAEETGQPVWEDETWVLNSSSTVGQVVQKPVCDR